MSADEATDEINLRKVKAREVYANLGHPWIRYDVSLAREKLVGSSFSL